MIGLLLTVARVRQTPKYTSQPTPSVTHSNRMQTITQDSSYREQSYLQQAPTIAIVDDDCSVRLATEGLVRSLGFVARTFASAQDFLQAPRFEETACLILDVQMPGMTGVDLQDDLLKRGHHIPIIFITAFPEDRVRDRVLRAGAVSFLTKPFDGRKMIDCLRAALQKHNGGADN
jgi:FixJ family two-component response regulator